MSEGENGGRKPNGLGSVETDPWRIFQDEELAEESFKKSRNHRMSPDTIRTYLKRVEIDSAPEGIKEQPQ